MLTVISPKRGTPSALNKLACYWFLLILALSSTLAEMRYRERNRGSMCHLHYQTKQYQTHFDLGETTLNIGPLIRNVNDLLQGLPYKKRNDCCGSPARNWVHKNNSVVARYLGEIALKSAKELIILLLYSLLYSLLYFSLYIFP